MTTEPDTPAACGWDQATYRCGRCGAEHTATTQDAYLKAVGVHTDAHAVWDRLDPIERDGLISILPAADLGAEFLALADRMKAPVGGGTQSAEPPPAGLGRNTPQPDPSPSNATARATE